MKTNIRLDDQLIQEALRYATDIRSKKELVEVALQEFVQNRKLKDIRELRGAAHIAEDYDYKAMRAAHDSR